MLEQTVIRAIEGQAWIDGVADPVQRALRAALARAPGVADVLHGKALGHPLHAALVALPVGALTTALVLDVRSLGRRGRLYRRGADLATKIGVVGALAAALPGAADWSRTEGNAKRVGFVHASLNLTFVGLYGASLAARARGHRRAGLALSIAGFALLGASGWLGGELSFALGVGVRPGARVEPEPRPERIGEARMETGTDVRL